MQVKKLAMVSCFATIAVATGAWATPSIEIDSVIQRWPWNNKVDITYTVTDGQTLSQDGTGDVYCRIVFNATIDGQIYEIDGVTNIGASASSGTHTVTWLPPAGLRTTDCVMSATLYSANAPSGDDYMIIDLQTGTVSFEGLLASQELSNARYNTATYKTTKMVLRKVPAGGTYPTGYKGESTNLPRTWTTDRDYYLGIFGVTQSQYTQLGFSNPVTQEAQLTDSPDAATDNDYAAHRPATRMCYDTLRGATTHPTNDVPVSTDPSSPSYLQRLNLKTGNRFCFDLPTEIMFEIAARAGTTDKYWFGQDPDQTKLVSKTTSPSSTKAVGLYPANGWGFYDMAGNFHTTCRDSRASTSSTAEILHEARDPWTPVGGGYDTHTVVQLRQGSYDQVYDDYRMGASNRGGYASRNWASGNSQGFRIACIMK